MGLTAAFHLTDEDISEAEKFLPGFNLFRSTSPLPPRLEIKYTITPPSSETYHFLISGRSRFLSCRENKRRYQELRTHVSRSIIHTTSLYFDALI